MTNGIMIESILNDILKEYEEVNKQQHTNKTKTKEYSAQKIEMNYSENTNSAWRHNLDSTNKKQKETIRQDNVADYIQQQDCWHYDYMEA